MHQYTLASCVESPDSPHATRFHARIERVGGGHTITRGFPSKAAAEDFAGNAAERLKRENQEHAADTFWGRGIHS